MAHKSPTGEFRLIEEIRRFLGRAPENSSIIMGIGDDAAIVKGSGSRRLALTVDTLIEGRHFDLSFTDYESVGWKAVAVNVSDLAAMGARPQWGLVQLTLARGVTPDDIRSIYKGIQKACKSFGCSIVGGNTTWSNREFSVSLTLVGESGRTVWKRSGAKKGDVIAVTGDLGGSAAGQALLSRTRRRSKSRPALKHLRPQPRLREAERLLKANVRIHACIDISDGLSSELHHLANQSRCGMSIDLRSLPIHETTRSTALKVGRDATDMALHGGEEYELLMTMSPRQFLKARKVLGRNITAIGTVTTQRGVFGLDDDGLRPMEALGFVHF